MTDPEPLWTAAQVAERFQVEARTVNLWARYGRIRGTRLPTVGRQNGAWRFTRAEVDRIEAEGRLVGRRSAWSQT